MAGFDARPVTTTDTEKRAHLGHFRNNSVIIDASLLPEPCDFCATTPLSLSHHEAELADD